MDSSNGLSAGIGGSLLDAESFDFPYATLYLVATSHQLTYYHFSSFHWDESARDRNAQTPFSLFQPDPISSFLDRIRMLDQIGKCKSLTAGVDANSSEISNAGCDSTYRFPFRRISSGKSDRARLRNAIVRPLFGNAADGDNEAT